MYTLGEIIAIKGLPCTGKSEIATCLGEWSNCPVLYIDDFLDAVSFERGYTVEFPPFRDEAERLHGLATNILFHVANRRLAFYAKRLVIKTSLCSTSELDLLVRLAAKYKYKLIIIECVMKNERRWKHRLEYKVDQIVSRFGSRDRQWYKPRSWKDVEEARDEYDARGWDVHIRRLVNGLSSEDSDTDVGDGDDDDVDVDSDNSDDDGCSSSEGNADGGNGSEGDDEGNVDGGNGSEGDDEGNADGGNGSEGDDEGNADGGNGSEGDDDGGNNGTPRVKRLMLNVVDDLGLIPYSCYSITVLTPDFLDAIQYLIDAEEEEEDDPYEVQHFNELRQFLLEKKLVASTSKGRSKNICSTHFPRNCVFKYMEAFQFANEVDDDDHDHDQDDDCYCGVCEERLVSGQPAYTCYFCILTLHKSCAELSFQHGIRDTVPDFLLNYSNHLLSLPDRRACQSCMETSKQFFYQCNGCYFKTHLITRKLPTIINHECHQEHFLSMRVGNTDFVYKACGACLSEYFHTKIILARLRYGCYICNLDYHIHCALGPHEVKHKHGGYEHVMKRMYFHVDAMKQEEDYWCDICYRDMDPQVWFYRCNECPYYIGHLHCALKDYYPIQMQDIARYT